MLASFNRWMGLLGCLFASATALASPLLVVDLVSSVPKIHQGEMVYVSAQLSGLRTAGLDARVGAFSLELGFDATQLQPFNVGPLVGFGTDLGDPGLGEAITFADFTTPGQLRIAETSLLDGTALGALQSDSIVLATFGFMLRSDATDSFDTLSVTGFSVADEFALPIADDQGNLVPIQTGSLTLAVPLPATLYLAVLALACALVTTRHRHARPATPAQTV